MSGYKKTYRNDRGYVVDASGKQRELTDAAIARCYDGAETALSEEEYMAALYPKNHDEYLVDGAILTCNRATLDVKVYRGKVYNVANPHKRIPLNVTENPRAEACGHLYHATVRDAVKDTNITPFHCNCSIEPHNDEEWDTLEADESYKTEGTCKALMNLNVEWDNLPADVDYLRFWNEDRFGKIPGITMSSMLFCKHGGIITPVTSGQIESIDEVFALATATKGGPVGDLTEEQMQQNARYIYYYFKNLGWTTEAICGVLGNMEIESGINPGKWQVWNEETLGYGLVQWSEDDGNYFLYTDLKADGVNEKAESNPQGLMNDELEVLVDTCQPSKYRWITDLAPPYYARKDFADNKTPKDMSFNEFVKSTCNPGDLALVFHACYERSGDFEERLQLRVDAANKWYDYFLN